VAIRVLIVDDSNFFVRRIGAALNKAADISIVGVANNGREAIDKAAKLKPDVITLDVEMPVMDGVTALKEIVRVCDAKVLMLSSLTYENAKITLDALDAGATDFLLKSYESLSSDNSQLVQKLIGKIREIAGAKSVATTATTPLKTKPERPPRASPVKVSRGEYKLVAIGASTGGPVALQKVLAPLPSDFPVPITVTQHMPGTFTGAFANRLNGLCQVQVVEAADRMPLRPGTVYIAPGGKQMVFEGSYTDARIRIRPTDPRLQYAPCVDVTFASASKIFNSRLLAIVLTGMGADGTDGGRMIKNAGGKVWAQDEASSVVYGMPMSIYKAGLTDMVMPLEQFAPALQRAV